MPTLDKLAAAQGTYQAIADRRRTAIKNLETAHKLVRRAEAQMGAADARRTVSLGRTLRDLRLSDVGQAAGAGLGAGVFLAIGIVVVMEVAAGVRRRRPVTTGSPAPA